MAATPLGVASEPMDAWRDPVLEPGTVARPLAALLGRGRTVRVGNLYGAALGHRLAALAASGIPLVVVTPDARSAEQVTLDVGAFLGVAPLPFAPWPREAPGAPPDPEVLGARLAALRALSEADARRPRPVVVAPLAALAQEVPGPAVLAAASVRLRPGDERPLGALLEDLATVGYVRVGAVEAPGEFAARGGVLDLWPWGAAEPVRVDYFGEAIEGLCALDPLTQRSGPARDHVTLTLLEPERWRRPAEGEGAEFLLAWLPADRQVVLVEQEAIVRAALGLGDGPPAQDPGLRRLEAALAAAGALCVSAAPEGRHDPRIESLQALGGLGVRRLERGERPAARARRLAEAFLALGERAARIVVWRRAPGEEERLTELLAGTAVAPRVLYREGALSRSFLDVQAGLAHVAYDDLLDLPLADRRTTAAPARARPLQDFLEVAEGAPVVHRHHGIGLFRGLVRLAGPDGEGEYLAIEFAEGTLVYVPVARIDLVQRYVGTGRRPVLSRVGGPEWRRRTERVAQAVEELAAELLDTQARRARRSQPPLGPDSEWQAEFEASFPHPLTADQAAAVAAVKRDLAGERPMDRLLCGDVGYGKTEVALRAVFKVVAAGRQAAVLVPTKVLAEQHVRTFRQRLAPYPLRVRALSGLHEARENRGTLEGLADGSVDVVVGTHRLLSRDVAFADLGLIVVDEEQRFGVKHKERLKQLRRDVDVLSLSATPIPRTLHMALLGLRDISNLTTPPLGRHPIETRVAREDDDVVRAAIRNELDRGGQVYFVGSRIRELPLVARWLLELVPELRLATIHGRMEKHQVEDRMLRFVRGEVDLLLATTIIESGLDIPNANTIVLRDADRYGLAELHQLRGRVGRERRRAHCLVLRPRGRPLAAEAAARLKAIEEYSELGAGFRIAMRDLEIRGAGNLLGPEQSGHIAAVGYDLYCRLLQEAVDRVRGPGRTELPALATVAFEVPGAVPEDYVGDPREKFRVFRRIAGARTGGELAALAEELLDRFGPRPAALERLLLVQRVRIVLGALGILWIGPGSREVAGVLLRAPAAVLTRLGARGLGLRALDPGQAFLPLPAAPGSGAGLLAATLARLAEAGLGGEAARTGS